ncbi:MAG: YceD family protein [Xanthomonadales bacterium]
MSRDFPDIVDPWKAADGRRAFGGTVPLARLERLTALLAPDGAGGIDWGEAAFEAVFGYDEQGLVTIRVSVRAELPLVCQRSLEIYLEPVDRMSTVAVITDIGEQESLPDVYEPVLVEDRRLALASLVEEELLLAVPQVPRKPGAGEPELPADVSLESASEDHNEPVHKPFAGLAGLMKEKDRD